MVNIKLLMFDYSITQRQMAEIIGCTQSEVSFFANGKRNLGKKHLDAIITRFGKDVIDRYTISNDPRITTTHTADETILSPDSYKEIKNEARKDLKSDAIEVDAEEIKNFSLPFVTNDIAQAPNLDIKALVTSKSPKLDRYPIGQKLASASYVQRIITEAMSGAFFFPGDVIILTYLEGKSQVTSGFAYLLDTKNYGTLFRLVTVEKDGLLLTPCSEDKERFKPIFLRDDEIYSYASLVMQIRTSFSFSDSVRLTEMVKQRDEEIAQLTANNQLLIASQDRCLSEIVKQNERMEKLVRKIIDKE